MWSLPWWCSTPTFLATWAGRGNKRHGSLTARPFTCPGGSLHLSKITQLGALRSTPASVTAATTRMPFFISTSSLAHSILGYLEKLNREDGITVLCSLHYLDLVQRYATNVLGLRDGRLVYRGSREDIRTMSDEQFKEIYGEEAVRVSAGRTEKG